MRAYFQGIGKRDYWTNSGYFWGAAAGQTWSTGFEEHLDYFRSENSSSAEYFGVNTDSYFPRPSFDESGVVGRNRQPQTRYVLNAAYIRLKNLQFGYRLPQKLTQKAGISQCRIYVSGENLWTGTRMPRMFDPETISGGGSGSADDWRKRYNGNAYPLSTVLSMGMSVTL